ncbi:hypothetical protein PPYR_14454 [Photinus pyralis]|uniref:MutL C-terminal dimerisation domain-containing protein n=1 Tax=Photinus pyralis TaxID=7054 RepID=A0A5N4A596_PHOPY|nr:mismatch repair endonuclease PMS2 isoform X2 [Photinus pyralis]KAB0792495.1 hypothetical protein PPYR_14454 [Photinus pyralis]
MLSMSNNMHMEDVSDNEESHSDTIKPINRNTVHRICSGQVVLSLAIAVKELVENALDAGAKSIDVRLKQFGEELVEVRDNGCGVRSDNFQALTLKYYTSKIREFSDLDSIATLGFRGEALSSLCALAELSITTRHGTSERGSKICYDNAGGITSQVPAAREIGTTVTLKGLFSTLPVRRKEFKKNLKKEYSKMCQMLQAYCLVAKGVKFTCVNETNNSPRSTVICTEGSSSVRDNIMHVFGPKQVHLLSDVKMIDPDESVLEEYKVRASPREPLPFNFELLISSASHGSGRSTNDRQFFYVNERPCEPNKISKLINDTYKQFNPNQFPFVFLNVVMEKLFVDVNVTPDKRQIFLEKEKLLLATLKTSLGDHFRGSLSTLPPSSGKIGGKTLDVDIKNDNKLATSLKLESFKKQNKTNIQKTKQSALTDFGVIPTKTPEERLENLIQIAQDIEGRPADSSEPPRIPEDNIESSQSDVQQGVTPSESPGSRSFIEGVEEEEKLAESHSSEVQIPTARTSSKSLGKRLETATQVLVDMVHNPAKRIKIVDNRTELESELKLVSSLPDSEEAKINDNSTRISPKNHTKTDDSDTTHSPIKSVTVRSSLSHIRERISGSQQKVGKDFKLRFRSKIAPDANKAAEQELQRQITRGTFEKMEIIGQFNLGFIITKFEDDLFIVDQHATDEKYNFEDLQRNTVIESQALVNPRSLELSADKEELLIENEGVFRNNGFKFVIDNKAPSTKKVKLSAVPISKNFVFGKDDIDEILFMLQEEVNHAICRPSRVRSMLASRACRKSVMVGCPLNQNDMRRIIDHMGVIDQPWNCPHGRPTIRHLINLQLIGNN